MQDDVLSANPNEADVSCFYLSPKQNIDCQSSAHSFRFNSLASALLSTLEWLCFLAAAQNTFHFDLPCRVCSFFWWVNYRYQGRLEEITNTKSKVLRCSLWLLVTCPKPQIKWEGRSFLAVTAAARSRDLGSLIKMGLRNFMPPVRLQCESTSVTVIDGPVRLCDLWASGGFRPVFRSAQ